ncbi:tumor necrosis factor receptor superfamily member 8 [Trichechus manatus latirostris]|uniref:Tumor necrosis factor receptor superfamily member 8 n=1 Tax=Trichechus manatus latirostris TaxID=127582 RepID=A0A2Y9R8N7_TRIMA|nr:tumor necrosis factor receptor superfamily member 8 [Trichechus manatus latirostris]
MFCVTSASNSCARCAPHTICPPGMIVKLQGTAERNTVCEPAPPGSRPGCSTSPEDCKEPASTTPDAVSSLTPPGTSSVRTTPLGEGPDHAPEDASKPMRPPHSPSSVGKLSPDPGLSPQRPCPQGSTDCRKQCGLDYYLDKAGRCTACVSCSRDDLVEKTPCTWNSSRVCECRPGMFCATSATNSCARCITRPLCPSGMVGKPQGTASRDTTYELPPSGTHPDCLTSPEDSETPSSSTTTPALMSRLDSQTSKRHGGSPTHAWEDTSTPTGAPIAVSSMEKPVRVAGPVLFWVTMVLLVLVVSGNFLLCHWKACRKGIRQKLHLCFPGQTIRPKPQPMDSKPGRKPTPCRTVSVVEPGPEEQGLMSVPAVETCPSMGTSCLESLRLLEASPVEGPSSPRDIPEPRATTEHTNNKIEKIYIMKADTVIVGTVKTEVPESRGLTMPVGPEFEEELEVDHTPHYPEQETEQPLGSYRDVMFSVEEEGKEEPLPITASEK